jgi:hypothetical protein
VTLVTLDALVTPTRGISFAVAGALSVLTAEDETVVINLNVILLKCPGTKLRV